MTQRSKPLQAIMPIPVAELLAAAAAQFGQRPAINFYGRRWSYTQLLTLVDRATRGLQDLGVGPGTRVGLCLPNTPYYVIFYYAVLKAGGTVVNFNPLYVERELADQIRDSSTTMMIVLDLEAIYRRVANVADGAGLQHIIICPLARILPPLKAAMFRLVKRRDRARVLEDRHHVAFAAVMRSQARPTPIAIDPAVAVAVLQYTGGTTGIPKGAMLTHANLVANCQQVHAHWSGVKPGQEKLLAVLPFFHAFAITSMLNYGIFVGAEIVLLPRFDVNQALATIARRKITIFHAVPTIYMAINAQAAGRKRTLASIEFSVSGGAPLPEDVRARFVALTGCLLVEGYGLTEASPVVACNPPDGTVKPGSVGLPLPGTTVEIRDQADPTRLAAPGEIGEVCVRGPQVMAGYWNRDADTEAAFHNGALRTGDLGYLDEEGYLFLGDRIKDIILCGGYNIYPKTLENALYRHPAVQEATVIGIPDAYRGQTPKAFVVLRPGQLVTGDELRTFLMDYVSKIALPKVVAIRQNLPKTMIGKLSKKELVAEEATKSALSLSVD